MVRRDPNTHDLTQRRLRIAKDVMFWPVRERGELVYRLEIPELHRFFRIGYEEYVLISLLDGDTTIPQACGLAAARLGSRAPTAAQANAIARWMLANDLAYLDGDQTPIRNRAAEKISPNQDPGLRLLGRLNPFWIKVPIPHGGHWLNVAANHLRPALSSRSVGLGIVLIAIAMVVLWTRWAEFTTSAHALIHPSNWIWLLVTWVILKVVHELGHAIACECQGGKVRESGFVLILFAPMAYVDVSSCWRMDSRWSRIAVAAAGMFVELVIAAFAILLWAWTDDAQTRFLLRNLVFAAGLSTLLFNANVLMRFDGYFILADLIDVPNLYGEASSMLRRRAHSIIAGQTGVAETLGGWRRHFVLIYALAALLWRVTICVSLSIAAATMLAGAGVVIAAVGIAICLGRPIAQLSRFFNDLRISDSNRFIRAISVSVVLLLIGFYGVFWVPLPTSIRAPGVARYLPETTLRSRVDGFISKVHATDGASVKAGEVLVELENRELSHRLRRLEIAEKQNAIRLRQATGQHDAGARQVLAETQNSINSQISQLRQQTAGLKVLAPRAGRVVARGLEATLGTYVREGDPILVVAAEADKEIIVMIDQDVVREVRPLEGEQIQVRNASFEAATGTLFRVEPRADNRLAEPSLAATAGGDLAVKTNTTDDDGEPLRLVSPHFRGRIQLEPNVAADIPAGMRMQVAFGYQSASIASRLHQSIRRLWHAAKDGASRD